MSVRVRTVEEGCLMAVEESWELTRWWREGAEAELSSLPTLHCSVVGFTGPGCFELEPDEFVLTPRHERQDQADGFAAWQA